MNFDLDHPLSILGILPGMILALAFGTFGQESMGLDLEQPIFLLGFIAIALFVLFHFRGGRGSEFAFSRVKSVKKLPTSARTATRWVPGFLRIAALSLLVFAAARPQVEDREEASVEGIDIFVVLDMSGSMAAVDMSERDIAAYQQRYNAEPPNRFEIAVDTLDAFVQRRERDRIGMVVFARDAFLQFPLTLDRSTIRTLLARLELNTIDASQTAIGNALGLSIRGLIDSDATSRAVILITDGKQQGGNMSPTAAASIASEEGIQIFPILVGQEGLTMVPVGPRRRGNGMMYAQQDYPVDPELLQRLADYTNGQFTRAQDAQALEQGLNAILDQLTTTAMTDVASVRETELFPLFSFFALLCLGLEALLSLVLIRRFP